MDLNVCVPGPEGSLIVSGTTRSDLPGWLAARGARTGAEIGVCYGEYSEELARGIPGLRLLCVDPWAEGKRPRSHPRSAFAAMEQARARLAPYDCQLIRQWSPAAASLVPDRSLDFVYLDADHQFESVVADIRAWLPKVRQGGVLAGHDYECQPNRYNQVGVAVHGWTLAHGVTPWYVLGTSEPHRTWLWIVP